GEIKQTIGVLRRGWRLIGISTLICLMVAIIYLARTKRIYQAEVRLLILQQGGRPLKVANTDPNGLMEGNEDYIPTHMLIVSSPQVVKWAIDKVGLDNLPSLLAAKKRDLDPVKEAIDHLKVIRPDRLARVVRVEYRAGERHEVVRTIEAITNSYKQFIEEAFQKNSSKAIAIISKARDDSSRELGELEAKYLELRRKNPALITGEQRHSFLADRLANWDKAANEAMVKAVQLKAQLELGRQLTREGTELWAVAHAIHQLGGDTNTLMAGLTSGASQSGSADLIRQLTQEQQQLAERFGPQYSKVRELQAQIDRIRGRVRGARSRLEGDEVRDLVRAIEQSLESVQAMRNELGKQFGQDQEKAKQFEADLLAEEYLRNKLERQRTLFNTVSDQLKQAQFIGAYSSITSQVIAPAKALRSPIYPRVGLTLALALVIGCTVGTGAAVVLDRLDQRVHSIDELRQLTGLVVLGQVALLPKRQSGAIGPMGLISYAKPNSYWAEAYRAIRINLDFLHRRDPRLQVLLVTSPYPGDGKTTAASNLAISFALAGRRVLLIDADLRSPSLDEVHGLRREPGLAHLLKDRLPLHQAVQRSRIENLEVITVGLEVRNPDELLSSPRLKELLDEACRAYDVIVLDSSPLLAAIDPAIVGAVVDGVVLVARPGMLRRRDVELVLELLRIGRASLLGMLVNGVSREDRSYSYDYLGYGRLVERHSGDVTRSIGAEDQSPEIVTQAIVTQENGQPGPRPV
ncbi:MAG: polysaccharide biosynthesis tyrosine autokinase, partial [Planctomycetaceae bacterium]|nr:polysaccharide biosynthesis tyrosine autokinase [Planctomycetaceae bacterium]